MNAPRSHAEDGSSLKQMRILFSSAKGDEGDTDLILLTPSIKVETRRPICGNDPLYVFLKNLPSRDTSAGCRTYQNNIS